MPESLADSAVLRSRSFDDERFEAHAPLPWAINAAGLQRAGGSGVDRGGLSFGRVNEMMIRIEGSNGRLAERPNFEWRKKRNDGK